MGNRFFAKTCPIEQVKGNVALLQKEGKSSFLANIHYKMDVDYVEKGDLAIVEFPKNNQKVPVVWGILKQKVEA